ncbi:MAG TPA: hypothetical protein VEH06_06920, partial [Candidatus Bathyarchaeia archaeon]|nr:hypothetical protein [Candidatus Bathyarchaeia archaeon]
MNAIISRTIGNTEEIAYRSYAATAEIVTAWTREGDAEGKISQIVNPNVTGVCVDVSVEPRP